MGEIQEKTVTETKEPDVPPQGQPDGGQKIHPVPKEPPAPDATPVPEQPKPPGPKKEIAEIKLNAQKGSELHLSLAAFQLAQKDVEKVNIQIERMRAEVRASEAQRGTLARAMRDRQMEFKAVMDKYRVPDGWSFFRQDDGTYLVRPAAPQQQPGPTGS